MYQGSATSTPTAATTTRARSARRLSVPKTAAASRTRQTVTECPDAHRAHELPRAEHEPEHGRRREPVAASRIIRAQSTSASVARKATSGCGWNIAAVLSTTGHAA